LLNAVFPYRLKVLGKNHPAVDLGDKTNGIAFQITSRTDADKIKEDLRTFADKNLAAEYPQGIRFLLLTDKKIKWKSGIKESFNRIVKGFDADQHIYLLPGIIEKLKDTYLEKAGPFQELPKMMEWQFGNKAGGPPVEFFFRQLFDGSRVYYEGLRGEYGRFRMLHIEDMILSRTESREEWVPQPVSSELDAYGKEETVITLLTRWWQGPCKHAVIVGDGGMGKTVSLVLLLDGFNEITVEKKELLLEIKRIMEQCPGTRIVLTSRYDMRGQFQWGNWGLVRLMKLEKEQVESYLQEKNLGLPGQARFLELIRNPMMLTLYAATCEMQNKNRESEHCCFKDRVESVH
jgi:hypothetical protein